MNMKFLAGIPRQSEFLLEMFVNKHALRSVSLLEFLTGFWDLRFLKHDVTSFPYHLQMPYFLPSILKFLSIERSQMTFWNSEISTLLYFGRIYVCSSPRRIQKFHYIWEFKNSSYRNSSNSSKKKVPKGICMYLCFCLPYEGDVWRVYSCGDI